MTSDITLNDLVIDKKGGLANTSMQGLQTWTPIGLYHFMRSDERFEGIFDGDNHAIKGLLAITKRSYHYYEGLFGRLQNADCTQPDH